MDKTKKKRLPQHRAAAYREAAHAVAAWHRGVMLMPISIFTRGKGVGKNVWHDPLRNVDMEWVEGSPSAALAERLAAVLIAGPAAEDALGPRLARGSASLGRLEDAKTLLAGRAETFLGRRVEAPLRGHAKMHLGKRANARRRTGGRYTRVRSEVRAFLARPDVRRAVEALAGELFARGTVRGGEAASIIERFVEEPRGRA